MILGLENLFKTDYILGVIIPLILVILIIENFF